MYLTIPTFFLISTFTNEVVVDKCEDIYHEREILRTQMEELKSLSSLKDTNRQKEKERLKKELSNYKEEIDNLNSNVSSTTKDIDQLKKELEKAKETIASLENDIASRETKIEQLQIKVSRLEKDNRRLKKLANSSITLKQLYKNRIPRQASKNNIHRVGCGTNYRVLQNGKTIAYVECVSPGVLAK